jgi:hypothetical protein
MDNPFRLLNSGDPTGGNGLGFMILASRGAFAENCCGGATGQNGVGGGKPLNSNKKGRKCTHFGGISGQQKQTSPMADSD